MSKEIDQKVVEMQFDNRQFESNVKESMSTLDKLKQSLNFNGAEKGLDGVSRAAGRVDMSPLSKAVDTIHSKFNALEVMSVAALANITNSAVNAGKRIVSALTIDPIKTGFQEYETQINSVQTILANTEHQGTNLQQVNAALDELNLYADKTIYNFTQMTRNIGTFTAAGVDLRTSVDSIRGIANLAAVSGSTSQQASTAMYQLSQAISAGRVSLMDWNSVVNAGMGGKVFQDALIRTSELLGTGAKAAIDTYGSFRSSLTQGQWLTTEVLTETLKQFAGSYSKADLIAQGFNESQAEAIANMAVTAENAATKVKTFTQLWDTLKESAQSGWTQSWEIIVGDFGEAKETLTTISDTVGSIIGEWSDARNTMLEGGLSTGWKQLLGSGIADEAGYIESIKEAARVSGDTFDKMVEDSEDFGDALKDGLAKGVITADTLSEAVFGLQKKMSGMSAEERKAAGYTSEMVKQIETLSDGIKDGSVSMDDFADKILKPSGRENVIQAIWNSAKALMDIIAPIKEAFRDVFPPTTGDQLYALTEGLRELTEKFEVSYRVSHTLKTAFTGIFSVLKIIKKTVTAVIKGFSPLLDIFKQIGLQSTSAWINIGDFLTHLEKSADMLNVYDKITETISSAIVFLSKVPEKLNDIFKSFAGVSVSDALNVLWNKADESVKNLITVFDKFKSIDTKGFSAFSDEISKHAEPLTSLFDGVTKLFSGIFDFFENLLPLFESLSSNIGDALGGIGTAISNAVSETDLNKLFDIFSSGVLVSIGVNTNKFISSLTDITDGAAGMFEQIGGVLDGVTGVLDGVSGCLETYQKDIQANTLLKIAGAIAILTASIVALSMIDSEKLSSALLVMSGEFAAILISMNTISKIMSATDVTGMTKMGMAMVAMSAAIMLLTSACMKLSGLDWTELFAGLTGIASLAAVLVISEKQLSSVSGGLVKGSAGLIVFAIAIRALVDPVKELGALDLPKLAAGLGGIGILCAELALFMNNTNFDGISVGKGVGLIALAEAINILADAAGKFAGMDIPQIVKGLTGVTVVLAEVTAFTKLTGDSKKVLSTSVGLTVLGAAMLVFGKAVANIGNMDIPQLIKGLAGMGVILAETAIAMNAMPANTPAIAAGLVLVGTALKIVAGAVTELGGMSVGEIIKSLIAMAGALGILVVAVNSVTTGLPGAAAMLAVAGALGILAPVLKIFGSMSMGEIGKSLLVLAGSFTVLGVAALVLLPITPAILALSGAVALFGVGALACSVGILALSAGLSALSVSGVLGVNVLREMFVTLGNSMPEIMESIVTTLNSLIIAVEKVIPKLVDTVVIVIDEMLTSIKEHSPSILNALVGVAMDILRVIRDNVGEIVTIVVDTILAVLGAINNKLPEIVTIVINTILTLLKAIADKIPDIVQAGIDIVINLINGLAQGIEENAPRIRDAFIHLFESLVEAVKTFLGIHSPSTVFADMGVNVILGFINGIGSMFKAAFDKIGEFVSGIIGTIKNKGGEFLKQGKEIVSGIIDGITTKISDMKNAASEMLSKFSDGIKTKISDFKQIGSDLMEGLKNGITSMADKVVEGATNIGDSVVNGLKDLLGIHSPSTVAAEMGTNFGQGFANGLDDSSTYISGSTERLAKSPQETMMSSLDSLVKTMSDKSKVFKNVGAVMVGNICKGISSNKKKISKQSDDLYKTAGDSGEKAGENFGKGYAIGNDKATAEVKEELKKILDVAKDEYDTLLNDYKNDKITQSEYDKQYTNLLKKYVRVQSDLVKYSQDEMSEYIRNSLKEVNDEYENKLGEIKQKAEDFAENVGTKYSDAIEFTTNKDIYDFTVDSYSKQLDELNKKLDESKEKYGENSIAVQKYQRQIDQVSSALEQYKQEYYDSGVDDDAIVGVQFTDKLREDTAELKQYRESLTKLMQRGVDQDMVKMIAEMEKRKGMAVVEHLNSLSEEEFRKVQNDFQENKAESKALGQILYSKDVNDATDKYVDDITNKLLELPESAREIGAKVVTEFADGYSDTTVQALKTIDSSTSDVLDRIQNLVNNKAITESMQGNIFKNFGKNVTAVLSPVSSVLKDFGKNIFDNLGKSVQSGSSPVLSVMNSIINSIFNSIKSNLSDNEFYLSGVSEMFQKFTSLSKETDDISPVIKPVVDLTDVTAGAKSIDQMIGSEKLLNISASYDMSHDVRMNENVWSLDKLENAVMTSNRILESTSNLLSDVNETVNNGFASMNDSFRSMGVVLDSGALVGEIVSSMNSKLGKMAVYRGRGI